ncbi:MAG: hypothetical protein HYT87_15705 [Nitrospirae bacterium]|nr:hypothetical protein [Nitrospirota bacterium]
MSTARFEIVIPPAELDTVDSWDKNLKSRFIKACCLASGNLFHPSLHTEKIEIGGRPALRSRMDDAHRIHFEIPASGQLRIRAVGGHRLEGIG